jgi:uncharacterized protein (DUF2164 family)
MAKKPGIEIHVAARAKAIGALRQYAADNFDEEIGDLKGALLLDFILSEIGPSIYNQGVADARQYMEERAADMEGAVHYAEFPATGSKPRR